MTHDEQLQFVLKFLYINRLNVNSLNLTDHNKSKWLFHSLKKALENQNLKLSNELLQDFLSILYNDGFLDVEKGFDEAIKITADYAPLAYFTLSAKGVAFYFSDTYELRRKRGALEIQLSQSQVNLNNAQNDFLKNQKITNDNIVSTNKTLKLIFFWTMIFIAITALPPICSLFKSDEIPFLKQKLLEQDLLLKQIQSRQLHKENPAAVPISSKKP